MIKTYRANTNISINVVLPSKKNLHISFNALSNGSSVYTTDNEEIQNAMECHYKFGKLFKLTGAESSIEKVGKNKPESLKTNKLYAERDRLENPIDEEDDGATDEEDDGNSDSEATSLRQIQVSDIAAAKDYLADKFGISRTSMRSTKAIMEHASLQGIQFVGL